MSRKTFSLGKKISILFLLLIFIVSLPSVVFAQATTVTGKVTGSDGTPLAGVTVQEKGSKTGTATDASGNFSLKVSGSDAVLNFSFVGYESQSVALSGRSDIAVSMKVAAGRELEQVVVIGYGTANKRDLTGSIVQVSGKEVQDKPNTNPVESLQGKVAGLSVVNNG
ncbi:MAG TPA: carboxypeptidase-like regulatory domain-containing protein, partial [Candidatus Babeliaceae bacterium]|nr:carboxypeptidase-like regulatory domain-containing protein [Candidatus Babeliaceae bacterium]